MASRDSEVPSFTFLSSLFLFCPSVPSFEVGSGFSIRVEIKTLAEG